MALKKRDRAVQEKGGPAAVDVGQWGKAYPLLWEYLSSAKYEDGSPRRLPTVTVFLGPEGLQASLNDRDQGLVAFVTAGSVEGLWKALEAGLAADSLDWRLSAGGTWKKKK